MLSRGLLSMSGIALAALVLACGCVNQPKLQTAAEAPSFEAPSPRVRAGAQPQRAPDAAPGTLDDIEGLSLNTADVLARKAESYSREIASLLAGRSGRADPAAAADLPPAPSQVKWADPDDFRLESVVPSSAQDRALPIAGDPPLVRPVIETSPSEANRTDSLSPLADPAPSNLSANTPASADEPSTQPGGAALAPISAGSSALLSEKLSSRVRDYPRDVSGHLEYQLLQLLLDEQVPQLSALASLPGEDRELVTAVLDGLSLFRSTLRSDNNMLLSRKIKPLIEMVDRLRSQADLTIPAVALCRSVEGFGKYDPIDPARFAAGAEHRAIIYCEVANFASNLNARQQWETKLKQDLVLYTEFGVPVWNDRTEEIIDAARNRRHDFFVNKRIVIPGNLTVGRYLLKVSIVDVQSNRVAEATVPLVIAAK